jgi:hypothetical protein
VILVDDQDGMPVIMCHYHPDQPATGWDWNDTPLCDCARGLDARDEAAQDWDRNDDDGL